MLLALLIAALPVCRYTVRDIGFVDLVGPEYRLSWCGPAADGLDGEAETLVGVLGRDGNVGSGSLGPDAAPPGWWLTRDGLDPIRLGVSGSGGLAAREAWEASVRSPVRDQLLSEALTSFATLLRIKGSDSEEEARIDAVIADARAGLAVLSGSLPRPVERPLVSLNIPADRREQERVTLWALGLDAAGGPGLAVVYGRGKLAGPVMVGQEITLEETLAQLALVGESCECDTSRDWFNEARLPMAWTDRQRARAASELGFDPESPMVKSEVVRILERGPMAGGVPREGDVDGIEALVFGYRESELTHEGVPAPVRDFEVDPGAPSRSPGLILEPTPGDDWGFESGSHPGGPEGVADASDEDAGSGPRQPSTALLVIVGLLAFLGLGLVAGGLVGVVGRRGPS